MFMVLNGGCQGLAGGRGADDVQEAQRFSFAKRRVLCVNGGDGSTQCH